MNKREAVTDFILSREGEVQGLQEVAETIIKSKGNSEQNASLSM